ncbi:MAG: hypothetical protein ACREAB_10925, partial [Blastocatellia bacterium]
DITGEEVYSTIYAFRESTLEPGVLWAGANDGPVHVSRDNGKTWRKVTPQGLPPAGLLSGGRVQNIEPSPHRKGSAYLAIYRYLLDDWQPYIYLTNDYGATWTRLTDGRNGIPANYTTRVVREDPDREGLLYAGTDFGMFISFDNGRQWQSFQLNLPVTPVTDIRVHHQDLAISTMGRSFWILDNVTPLHQTTDATQASAAHLFKPRAAYRMRYTAMSGPGSPEHPPAGAHVDYYLTAEPAGESKLEVLDENGRVVRTISSQAANQTAVQSGRGATLGGDEEMRGPRSGPTLPRTLPKKAGSNRFTWDLRYDGGGPLVAPGKYQLKLSGDGWSRTQALEVRLDPRLEKDGVTIADLREQLQLLLKIRETAAEARRVAQQLDEAIKRLGSQNDAADRVAKLQAVRARLITAPGPYPQPMLIDQLSSLSQMAGSSDRRVGRSALEYFEVLKDQLAAIKADVSRLLAE